MDGGLAPSASERKLARDRVEAVAHECVRRISRPFTIGCMKNSSSQPTVTAASGVWMFSRYHSMR